MTETRLKELQTEIARLQEIDNKITERVNAEFAKSADNSRKEGNHASARIIESNIKEIEIPCSLELDMEMANESENIQ